MNSISTYRRWQLGRQAELAGPDSWRGLLGLFWLQPGRNAVGNSPGVTVELPSGPPHLGDLVWEDGQVFWHAPGASPRGLATDHDGMPDAVEHENLSFFIVDRDGRLAVRLRDRDWAMHAPAAPLEYFPYDAAWRIEAQWQTLVPSVTMEVPNVSGDLKAVQVAHQAVFKMGNDEVSLLPMSVGDDGVFFVFRDRTSGRETYGAGRFLKVPAAVDGRITLDFNFAYNPPCAFTAFATCPLPPPENWLPFAVPAGEKKWIEGS